MPVNEMDPDYKDYQDYLEYQQHIAAQPAKSMLDQSPVAALRGLFGKETPDTLAADIGQRMGSNIDKSGQMIKDAGDVLSERVRPVQYGPPLPQEQLPVEQQMGHALVNAGMGSLSPMQGVEGLKPVAGNLMNKAVGLEDAPAEVGQRLLDQGIYGTRSGMLKQIDQKLPEVETGLQQAIASNKPIPTADIPGKMAGGALQKYTTGSGMTGIGFEPEAARIQSLANEAGEKLGETTPAKDVRDLMSLLGKKGYGEGEELKSAVASAARSGREGMRDALTSVYPEVDPMLKDESAMLEAKRGLDDTGLGAFFKDLLKAKLSPAKAMAMPAVKSTSAAAINAVGNQGQTLDQLLKLKAMQSNQNQ